MKKIMVGKRNQLRRAHPPIKDLHYCQPKCISDSVCRDENLHDILPVCCFVHTSADERFCTLEVCDHDLCVVGASEQVVCSGGESDRSHIAGVWPVHLDDSSSSDVIQHACTVFLSCC